MTYDNPNSKPTIAQLDYLKILGYTGKIPETKFQASLLIANLRNGWRLREPSQEQISYLKKLGHKGPIPKTRGSASDLIQNILDLKKIGINANNIAYAIYGNKWSEKDWTEHLHEHTPDFEAAKEWRNSLDN